MYIDIKSAGMNGTYQWKKNYKPFFITYILSNYFYFLIIMSGVNSKKFKKFFEILKLQIYDHVLNIFAIIFGYERYELEFILLEDN